MANRRNRDSRGSEVAEAIKPLIVLILLGMILYGGYSVVQKAGDSKFAGRDDGPASAADDAPPFEPTVEMPVVATHEAPRESAMLPPTTVRPDVAPSEPDVGLPATATYVSGLSGPAPQAEPAPPPSVPEMTGPEMTGPETIGPETTGPEAIGPEVMTADGPAGPAIAAVVPATPPFAPQASPATPPSAPMAFPHETSSETDPTAASEASADSSIATFTRDWEEAHVQLAAGRYAEALALLSTWHDRVELGVEESQRLEDLLSQLAGTVIYSQQDLLLPPHIVSPGETLEDVAAPLQVSWQLLGKINGVQDPRGLVSGEPLKVLRGPFDAEVSLSRRRMTLRLTGNYAGSFALVAGREIEARAGSTLGVVAIDRETPAGDSSDPAGRVVPVAYELPESAAIRLEGGVVITGDDDPARLADAVPPSHVILGRRDLGDLIDILGPASRITIRH